MPHLTGDVAEGVWNNTLVSKVFRLATGEERGSSICIRSSTRPIGTFAFFFEESCLTILLLAVREVSQNPDEQKEGEAGLPVPDELFGIPGILRLGGPSIKIHKKI